MIIDTITLTNFGVYRGHNQLELTPRSENRPVVLIGGMNGGGKTTLLDGLQLALYGKNANSVSRRESSYDDYLLQSINRAATPQEGASVEVAFRYITEGEEQRFRVKRQWRREKKKVREEVEVWKNDEQDSVMTEAWAEVVDEFIPSRMAHLFFFDGEQIESLANEERSSEVLSTALHSLLGLDLVDKLITDIGVYEKRKKSETKAKAEQQRIGRLESRAKNIDAQIDSLLQEQGSTRNQIGQLEKELQQLERQIQSEGGEQLEKSAEIRIEHKQVSERLDQIRQTLRVDAEDSIPLLMVRDLLDEVHELAQQDKERKQHLLLSESLKHRYSIILDEAKREGLETKALTTLTRVLNRDQSVVERKANTPVNLDVSDGCFDRVLFLRESGLNDLLKRVRVDCESTRQVQNQLDNLDRKIESIPDPAVLAPLLEKRKRLEKQIDRKTVRIEVIDSEIEKLKREKQKVIGEIKEALEMRFDQEDSQRLLVHARKVVSTMKTFRDSLIRRNIGRIEELVLSSLHQLLRKRALVKSVAIDCENYGVQLIGGDNKPLSPSRLSAGERQLLATALLWGLARSCSRPLPAIIDTPLGRLDSSHRAHLVERYFPCASHQVILLSTDKEIDEEYYKKLKPRISKTYLLEYDEQKAATTVSQSYFW